MKKQLLSIIVFLIFYVFCAGSVWGAPVTHCVTNATDLQAALTTAQANGFRDIIQVVSGPYSGHFTYNSTEGLSIELQGGYTAECDSRVVDPANTILDGSGTGRVLYLYNDNGGSITVDGFTIQHGGGATTDYGAGVNAYSNNSTEGKNMNSGDITITNNILSGNTGTNSGALHVTSSSVNGSSGNIIVSSNVASGNSAGSYGGGVYVNSYAGAGTTGTVTISSNTIIGNTVTTPGSGGGGVNVTSSNSSTGGAITFTSNTIRGNTATNNSGGGVYAYSYADSGTGGTVTFTNNIVTGNTASGGFGGGVYAFSSAGSGGTGGVVTFTNNTITGNTAGDASGLYLIKYGNTNNVYNNIIWGNTGSTVVDIYVSGSSGTVNGYNNDYSEMSGSWTNSGGNIDANPLFVDASVSNYHLSATSPCFGTGDASAPSVPSTDFEGDSRTHSVGTLDMGADEYTCGNYPFQIGASTYNYTSIQNAYDLMSAGATLLIHSLENTENLAFNINKTVTLKGGYGCGFSSNPGYTRVKGSLTISSGTVTVENIKIK